MQSRVGHLGLTHGVTLGSSQPLLRSCLCTEGWITLCRRSFTDPKFLHKLCWSTQELHAAGMGGRAKALSCVTDGDPEAHGGLFRFAEPRFCRTSWPKWAGGDLPTFLQPHGHVMISPAMGSGLQSLGFLVNPTSLVYSRND